jgi:hypothetical protein
MSEKKATHCLYLEETWTLICTPYRKQAVRLTASFSQFPVVEFLLIRCQPACGCIMGRLGVLFAQLILEHFPSDERKMSATTAMNPAGREITDQLFVMQIHLFDIDVPGKITFQESKTLSPGDSFSTFDTRTYQISLPFSIPEKRSWYFFLYLLCLPPVFSHNLTERLEARKAENSQMSGKFGLNGELRF